VKILLTGSTGMLGRAILRMADADIDIKAMVRNRDQIQSLESSCAAPVGSKNRVEDVVASLESMDSLAEACSGVDLIVHSAALSSPWGRKPDFERVNVAGTEFLLKAAEMQNVSRMVFISSPSIYFDYNNASQITEQQTLPAQFCNDYAASKARAESLVLGSGIDACILRPRGIFGPHDRAIVPRLLAAVKNNKLVLPSNRNPLVDMTYVDNVALAVNKAIKTEQSQGIFNITNDQPLHLHTMLKMLLAQLAPDTRIKTLPYGIMSGVASVSEFICSLLPGHPEPRLTSYSAGLFNFDQSLCIDEAITKLDYRPAISIEEGIERYAQWYRCQRAS